MTLSRKAVVCGEWRADDSIDPPQVYTSPWEVLRGSNVKLENENRAPVEVEIVIPLPLIVFIVPPSTVQATVGGFIKPSMADTLQVSVYISLALAMPELSTLTWIALVGTEKIKVKTKSFNT